MPFPYILKIFFLILLHYYLFLFTQTNKLEIDMVIYSVMKWITVDLLFYLRYLFVNVGKLTGYFIQNLVSSAISIYFMS